MTFEDIKKTFIAYLKDNAHRITNERFLILNAALNMEEHFDADELYLNMKNDYLNVSRATVYKTLELMSECDILTKHNFKGDRTRYETKIGRKPHYHLICVNCNKIIEFEYPQIEKIQDKICKENNFKMVDHTLQVFAKCNDVGSCKNNSGSNSN
ncbi:MAG TPA: transcriptional repressor [Ignavibacteria bacterium]|nr:transcriptional repressor [Ignavibacteria bacterium]HRB00249.1 transcriptional repressor [Ignavibacteria bacterium]